jgi:hypothetical protein
MDPGGGRCCQKFAWNTQWFLEEELQHGRLQVFNGSADSEEDEGEKLQSNALALGILWRL